MLFICNFFEPLGALLHVRPLTPLVYHLQTNMKAERLKKRIITRPRHYLAEHQRDWDTYELSLAYEQDSWVHQSRILTLFCLVLSCHPTSTTTSDSPTDIPTNARVATSLQILIRRLLNQLYIFQKIADKKIK